MIFMRQSQNMPWTKGDTETFIDNIGIFSPLIVDTQEEVDYLNGLKLVIGEDFTVLLKDVDDNRTGLPPTFIRIDNL